MNPSSSHDQLYIAESFLFIDDHINQISRLAVEKVRSWKMATMHAAYCKDRKEIYDMIRKSLLNFVTPGHILCEEKFFATETEN